MKRAVIYYSLTDNTKQAAEYLAGALGADLFRVELVEPLPESTAKRLFLGGMQATLGKCPAVRGLPESPELYDEIILGMPVWAGKPASPINTLLQEEALAHKVTAVFTFSGGGNNEKCVAALSKKVKGIRASAALADRSSKNAVANEEKLKRFAEEIMTE